MLFIFDLDGTTINSTHRLGNGTLADWQKNATPENIANDSLLPLGNAWKGIASSSHPIVVMTARVMADADYDFLINNGLRADFIYSRPEGVTIADNILKRNFLISLKRDIKKSLAWIRANAYFFDDNKMVRETMKNELIRAFDPIDYNMRHSA